MKRRIYLIGLICLIPAMLFSATAPEDQIRVVADNFLASRAALTVPAKAGILSIKSIERLYDQDRQETFAFVATVAPQGFLVLSAATELPPVIAYSFRLDWNADTTRANEFYQLLKHDLSVRDAAIPFMAREVIDANEQLWRKYLEAPTLARTAFAFRQWPEPGTTATGGWVKTTWEQFAPYNNLCPLDPVTNERCIVGCVATAFAQVLHYFKYIGDPQFDQNNAYATSHRGIEIDADSSIGDFPSFERLNGYLDEVRRKYNRGQSLSDRDRAAVCFAAAVAVHMDFASESSAAQMAGIRRAFLDEFGYYSVTRYSSGTTGDSPTSIFYHALQENLMNAMPAILGIGKSTDSIKHAVVCDGYNNDGFYHINFGWGSGAPEEITDAWYFLPNDLPAGYDFVDSAVIDIMPTAAYEPELVCGLEVIVIDASPFGQPSQVQTFVLRNNGAATATIDYILASQNFRIGITATELADSLGITVVPPGGEITLYVQCVPDTIGPYEGSALIASPSRNEYLNIHLSAFGAPAGGTIITDALLAGTLLRTGSPYYLCRSAEVPAGERLEVTGGSEILAFEGCDLTVGFGAQLVASGACEDSIYFRAWDPSKGWAGIKIDSSGSDDLLSHCVITDSHNGGVSIRYASPTILHSRIAHNQTDEYGDGAGIHCEEGTLTMRSCIIDGNSAGGSGGAFCFVNSSAEIGNTLICRNQAGSVYRSPAFMDCFSSTVTFNNLTVADNVDADRHGFINMDDSHLIFINSILWSAGEPGDLNIDMGTDNRLEFHYSDIYTTHLYKDWSIVGFPWERNSIVWSDGCIATLPQFTTENGSEYVLQDGSPCIDAGDPNPMYCDIPDPNNPGFARWPAKGTIRNDRGFYGGAAPDIPVPVELVSFNAAVENCDVRLTWTTETESNNYGFVIERSPGDKSFENVAFVKGHGTTLERQNYAYVDEKLPPGNYSYRLKQIDYDGAFEYWSTIEVLVAPPDRFSLAQNYPNPFNANTIIEYALPKRTRVRITLYNLLGAKVKTLVNEVQSAGVHRLTWEGSDEFARLVGSGIYFYEMQAGDFRGSKRLLLIR